jgi:CRP-like cAMP-binding protein
MTSALVRKLTTFADLNEVQRNKLDALCSDVRTVASKTDIASDGDRPESIQLIVDGWAARYKHLPDGGRQIMAFLLPGDLLDAHVTILGHMDHGVRAITRCKVAYIKADSLDTLTSEDNLLARACWWSTLVDEATLRSWIVSLGRRDAYERVAHLLCEIHARAALLGLVHYDRFDLPFTQEEIADATGLTAVHTNRTLQRLRAENLIELSGKVLTVLDVTALQEVAGFDPSFLHLVRRIR